MSEGQRVLWKFKAKIKPTVPLGQLPYQGATSYFWSILGDKKSNGFYIKRKNDSDPETSSS
jgi:hypothetical protein